MKLRRIPNGNRIPALPMLSDTQKGELPTGDRGCQLAWSFADANPQETLGEWLGIHSSLSRLDA